jgi:hypothetical protein
LALFARKDNYILKKDNYHTQNEMIYEKIGLLQEILRLEQMSLLNMGNLIPGLTDIIPARMNVEGNGKVLYNLMELSEINSVELDALAQLLR